jgi:hypothetical protein
MNLRKWEDTGNWKRKYWGNERILEIGRGSTEEMRGYWKLKEEVLRKWEDTENWKRKYWGNERILEIERGSTEEMRGYWKLKEEILNRTTWRGGCGRGYEIVVGQTTGGMSALWIENTYIVGATLYRIPGNTLRSWTHSESTGSNGSVTAWRYYFRKHSVHDNLATEVTKISTSCRREHFT